MTESESEPRKRIYPPSDYDLSPFSEAEETAIDPVILKKIEAHISWAEAQSGLGKAPIEFQILETAIKDAIAFLINDKEPKIGRITTVRMNFIQLLNVLCALFANRSNNESDLKRLRGILKECVECNKRRNELVHSFWYSDEEKGVAVRLEIRVGRGQQTYNEHEESVPGLLLKLDAKFFNLTRRQIQVMDWIEHLFHVSPDGGNGSLELLLLILPMVALAIGYAGLLWFRFRRKKHGKCQ